MQLINPQSPIATILPITNLTKPNTATQHNADECHHPFSNNIWTTLPITDLTSLKSFIQYTKNASILQLHLLVYPQNFPYQLAEP